MCQWSMDKRISDVPRPFVVIGGGIAGVTCAKTFAVDNPDCPVVLVTQSPMVKSVANLRTIGRSIDMFDVIEVNSAGLHESHLNLQVVRQRAVGLDAANRRVRLADGTTLAYWKICLCTGARPQTIPQSDPKTAPYIKYVRDSQTAEDMAKMVAGSRRVLVAGNGGIATEVVYAIQHIEVGWLIRDTAFGARFFDAGAAKFFSDFLERSGNSNSGDKPETIDPTTKLTRYCQENKDEDNKNISDGFGAALGPDWSCGLDLKGCLAEKRVWIESQVEIRAVYATENCNNGDEIHWPIQVELSNGRRIGTDMLIVGFGVVPNTEEFLSGNPEFRLTHDGALWVDQRMRTTVPDVYAAGDVCAAGWPWSPHWFQMRLWTQARQMGLYAAKCIRDDVDPVLYFNFEVFAHVTRFFSFRVVLLGLYNGQTLDESGVKILARVQPRHEYVKVILGQDGRMKGAIIIGNECGLEETFEFLIANQIDLSQFGDHLLDNVLDLEDYFD